MSELLVLRLLKPLVYARCPPESRRGADDSIEIHRFSEIFDLSGPDGPEASLPGPGSLIDSGRAAEGGDEASFALEPGSYLFKQVAVTPGFDLGEALRIYIRDAWWEGRLKEPSATLTIRWISEDGKDSAQFLLPQEVGSGGRG